MEMEFFSVFQLSKTVLTEDRSSKFYCRNSCKQVKGRRYLKLTVNLDFSCCQYQHTVLCVRQKWQHLWSGMAGGVPQECALGLSESPGVPVERLGEGPALHLDFYLSVCKMQLSCSSN